MRTSLILTTLLIAIPILSSAQSRTLIIQKGDSGQKIQSEGDVFMVPELNAVIAEDSGKISVLNIIQRQGHEADSPNADIKEGDMILMANGKSMKSLGDLKDLYSHAGIGTEVKLGLKRGEAMLMTSFKKADPKDLPQGKVIINRVGPGGDDMVGMPGVGVFMKPKGKHLVVDDVLPISEKVLKPGDIRKGDIVSSINGKAVSSPDQFSDAFSKIKVGDPVELKIQRGKTTKTVSFSRPKDPGRMVIRRKG